MRVLVDFEFCDVDGQDLLVCAEVELGKTTARGDSPSEVVELNVYDSEGDIYYVTREEYSDLCELSLIEAMGVRDADTKTNHF